MAEFAAPALFTVVVWWFTTGAILFLDGLPPRTFRWSMSAATLVLLGAVYAVHATRGDVTVVAAYTAFTLAILTWGWLEMSFLMGFITGPRKHACAERCHGVRHFVHAIEAILYNELATLAGAVVLWVATWHGANRMSLWTFLILWSMRVSAKLNLFFGVPNLGEKFLPPHLKYLRSFFKKRSMNFLFPVSIIGSALAVCLLVRRYLAADDAFTSTELALAISLLSLAVVEHGFMVLPLPSERMWKWAMRAGRATP